MKFQDFFNKATAYLPKIASVNGKNGVDVIFAFEDSYKKDIEVLCPKDGKSIVKNLSLSTGFEGKAGITQRVILEKSVYVVCIIAKNFDSLSSVDQQEAGAKLCPAFDTYHIPEINLILPKLKPESIYNFLYGLCLRNYRFNDFFANKLEGKAPHLTKISVSGFKQELVNELVATLENVMLARHLVNYPSTDLNPESYSKIISQAFGENVSVKILGTKEMEKLGMNLLLAVGRASNKDSKMVIMEYKGDPKSNEYKVALVGKGVCFDSGGLDIKTGGNMEDMKMDMGGSAVAFTSLRLIAQQKLKINAVALVGLVENMVAPNSYRAGDVLKSMSGQTVEVLNTDAEGRLVLGDVLYYAQKNYKPEYMVNYATLTGAVTVALGDVFAGYMSNDDAIAKKLEKSAEIAGENIWRLPLHKRYDKMIDSSVADMKNIGSGRGAGTITAGQFLARFVNCEKGMKTKWAHLDIAGVAFDGKGGGDIKTLKGGTGHSVHLTYQFTKQESK